MTSNATIVFPKPGEIALQERDVPVLTDRQLLIKTSRTMISLGTEFSVLERKNIDEGSVWDKHFKFPFAPGYNNIGVVINVGSDVDRDWVGKTVATYGNHAQFVVANVQDARIVREGIQNDHAAFFTFAEIVMNGIRRGNVRWGDSVAIYGLGLLGQLAVRFCRLCGAKPVFGVDISEKRLAKIPREKGTFAVNSQKDNLAEIVLQATRGRKVDIVYEVTGVAELIPGEFDVLRNQGRFVILSSPRGKTLFDFHDLCNFPSFDIIGAHNYSHPAHETLDNPWTMKRDSEYFFDMIADGEVNMEELISRKVHYAKAADTYHELLEDRSNELGVIIEWD